MIPYLNAGQQGPPPGGPCLLPSSIDPEEHPLTVRGREFRLVAMADEALIDWAELQILCAREKVLACRFTDVDSLREKLTLLFRASDSLVVRALGCDLEFARSLSDKEKEAVVEVQDRLNGMHQLARVIETSPLMVETYLAANPLPTEGG